MKRCPIFKFGARRRNTTAEMPPRALVEHSSRICPAPHPAGGNSASMFFEQFLAKPAAWRGSIRSACSKMSERMVLVASQRHTRLGGHGQRRRHGRRSHGRRGSRGGARRGGGDHMGGSDPKGGGDTVGGGPVGEDPTCCKERCGGQVGTQKGSASVALERLNIRSKGLSLMGVRSPTMVGTTGANCLEEADAGGPEPVCRSEFPNDPHSRCCATPP